MVEPEKPFACGIPDCGMTFTNEDHLHVHTKKHDMMLLGLEQKVFVADQTPTPTRFIRNCEDLGIFQDLQNVNPFDEGFKQAMETAKHGMLSLENPTAVDPLRCHQTPEGDVLHTPQFIDPRDSALYTSNHRNITISRSSSDESGVIKEYETTTISKLTNEVTTISRVVNKHDVIDKIHVNDDVNDPQTNEHVKNDVHNETSVSFTNNVIKIHNNIEIRKDNLNAEAKTVPVILSYDKDAHSIITKDVLLTDSSKDTLQIPPIMSQKSFDFVVDRLTSDLCKNEIKKPAVKEKPRKCAKPLPKAPPMFNELKNTPKNNNDAPETDDYEVIIKLPNGKQVRMKSVEEINSEYNTIEKDTKEKLKLAINNKAQRNTVLQRVPSINTIPSIFPYSTGTLIPVTIVNSNSNLVQKIPIVPFNTLLKPTQEFKKTVKRKTEPNKVINVKKKSTNVETNREFDDDCVIVNEASKSKGKKRTEEDMNSRVAASRRYRMRLRESMRKQEEEIQQLRDSNQRLVYEKATLQLLITEHLKTCPDADNLRDTQAKLQASSSTYTSIGIDNASNTLL